MRGHISTRAIRHNRGIESPTTPHHKGITSPHHHSPAISSRAFCRRLDLILAKRWRMVRKASSVCWLCRCSYAAATGASSSSACAALQPKRSAQKERRSSRSGRPKVNLQAVTSGVARCTGNEWSTHVVCGGKVQPTGIQQDLHCTALYCTELTSPGTRRPVAARRLGPRRRWGRRRAPPSCAAHRGAAA